jgi:type IV pilus assembly protein PilV
MNDQTKLSLGKSQQGVVLLESLIAILIFSLGVLGIVGLQATMIKSTADAKFRSEASYIAQQQIGQMWANPTVLPADLDAVVDISAQLPSGTRTVTQPVAGQFQVRITWQQPGDPDIHNFTTVASISGG